MRRPIGTAGLKLIKAFEGLSLTAYPDPGTGGEPWTIGWGHTDDVRPGQRITRQQAERFLVQDTQDAADAVDRLVKVPLNRFQRDALISFAFNAGIGALEDSTLLRKLNHRNRSSVPNQLMRWVHAGGAVLQGLVRRRKAEGRLFRRKRRRRK